MLCPWYLFISHAQCIEGSEDVSFNIQRRLCSTAKGLWLFSTRRGRGCTSLCFRSPSIDRDHRVHAIRARDRRGGTDGDTHETLNATYQTASLDREF